MADFHFAALVSGFWLNQSKSYVMLSDALSTVIKHRCDFSELYVQGSYGSS